MLKNKHPVLGWFMTLVGIVGFLLCLIAMGWVWTTGHRVQQSSARMVGKVETGMQRLGKAALTSEKRIERTRRRVIEVDARIKQRISDKLGLDGQLLTEIGDMEQQVQTGLDEVQGRIDVAANTLALVEEVVGMVESLGISLEKISQGVADIQAAFLTGSRHVDEAGQALTDIRLRLESIGKTGASEEHATRIDGLARRIDASLMEMLKMARIVDEATERVTASAKALREKLQRLLFRIGLTLSLLLAWQAFAQGCLALVGYRLTRQPNPLRGTNNQVNLT